MRAVVDFERLPVEEIVLRQPRDEAARVLNGLCIKMNENQTAIVSLRVVDEPLIMSASSSMCRRPAGALFRRAMICLNKSIDFDARIQHADFIAGVDSLQSTRRDLDRVELRQIIGDLRKL